MHRRDVHVVLQPLHAALIYVVHAGVALADHRLEADGVHIGHAGDNAVVRIRQRIKEQAYAFAVGRYVHALAFEGLLCAAVRKYGNAARADAVHPALGQHRFARHQEELVFERR